MQNNISNTSCQVKKTRGVNKYLSSARRVVQNKYEDWLNENEWKEVIKDNALLYIEDNKDKWVQLVRSDVIKDIEELLLVKCKTRFDVSYTERTYARIMQLKPFFESHKCLFMTLTVDPKRFNSLAEAIDALIKGWNKLLSCLKRKFGRKFPFIAVIEFQKSGNPHLHILIGSDVWIDVNWLRNLWENKYKIGTFVNVKFIDKGRVNKVKVDNKSGKSVWDYILKYTVKAISQACEYVQGNSSYEKSFSHLAYLWALGRRGFRMSRDLVSLIKYKNNSNSQGWVLDGIIRGFDIKTFINSGYMLVREDEDSKHFILLGGIDGFG